MLEGGERRGEQENEERQQERHGRQAHVLSAAQAQTLRDLHRKVKGTYMQLTQLLKELALLDRSV